MRNGRSPARSLGLSKSTSSKSQARCFPPFWIRPSPASFNTISRKKASPFTLNETVEKIQESEKGEKRFR